ncbi:rhodanese-like domain-containing protein [Hymenobacter sp. HSC-4F20]|uniref:rhodanese-like domain-containing protein n=1 Tax=Hymenobacter sp. HSC-4F20 TaxID=2864135 RepID=UPI001C7374A1|nr:rhodanese-like domain-containing protein [Hymenobacter sp. HSC-4F20]MBX0289842.1 rhodanese-like domain-containing protein [Hymenobacter sp. HSC-4F20]
MLLRLYVAAALLSLASPGCSQTGPGLPITPPATVQQQLTQPNTVLLDVRSPEEFAAGHLTGARNLDFRAADFAGQVARLDPNQTYVLYCASGNRSGKAAVLMQGQGFTKVVNAGGFETLKSSGLPVQ